MSKISFIYSMPMEEKVHKKWKQILYSVKLSALENIAAQTMDYVHTAYVL